MKFSVFTVMLPENTPDQAIRLLKSNGYDGVEWRVTKTNPARKQEEPSFWGNNLCTIDPESTEAQLQELRKLTEEAGLEVPNLACYLTSGDLAGTERDMKTARMLGAPSIRIGVPLYDRSRNYHDLFAEARQYLQGVQDLSRQYGIKGIIEIHMGNIATSASLAHRLLDGFDPSCIGVIYDPGNMVYEGYENYRLGLQLLGDYVAHVHLKNSAWVRNENRSAESEPPWTATFAGIPEGIVHWTQVLADLKAVGYDGWLSFEDFSKSAPAEQLLGKNLQYIKSLL